MLLKLCEAQGDHLQIPSLNSAVLRLEVRKLRNANLILLLVGSQVPAHKAGLCPGGAEAHVRLPPRRRRAPAPLRHRFGGRRRPAAFGAHGSHGAVGSCESSRPASMLILTPS